MQIQDFHVNSICIGTKADMLMLTYIWCLQYILNLQIDYAVYPHAHMLILGHLQVKQVNMFSFGRQNTTSILFLGFSIQMLLHSLLKHSVQIILCFHDTFVYNTSVHVTCDRLCICCHDVCLVMVPAPSDSKSDLVLLSVLIFLHTNPLGYFCNLQMVIYYQLKCK